MSETQRERFGDMMGTWGAGPLDDDTAMDFVDGLVNQPKEQVHQALEHAVRRVRQQAEPEYASAVEAVAAAALLAGKSLPADILAWRASLTMEVTADLAADALRAVERAYSPGSELWDLGSTTDWNHEAWKALADTISALRAIAEPPQTESLF